MPRNVEIKARVFNFKEITKLAQLLCGAPAAVLKQQDSFFKVDTGRLKLRNFLSGESSQLIYYNRPNTEAPKLSDYSICEVSNPEELNAVLSSALGLIGSVSKVRHLFLYEQTRIHLDQVEGLGDFMELEVVLEPDQTLEQGQDIAKDLMRKLQVEDKDLISGAYLDQLK